MLLDEGWAEAGVYRLEELRPGAHVEGPAVLEGYDTTVLVPLGFEAHVDEYGGVVMSYEG